MLIYLRTTIYKNYLYRTRDYAFFISAWGNKLVTIFALHLDNFILTRYISSIYLNRESGSGQISAKETIKSFAGIAKTAPWWLARRDSFSAKVPGLVSGWLRRITLTPSTAGPLLVMPFTTACCVI